MGVGNEQTAQIERGTSIALSILHHLLVINRPCLVGLFSYLTVSLSWWVKQPLRRLKFPEPPSRLQHFSVLNISPAEARIRIRASRLLIQRSLLLPPRQIGRTRYYGEFQPCLQTPEYGPFATIESCIQYRYKTQTI